MELRQAIGCRRSMRFLLPYKPVEPEKIQCMLEAARIASHWGNVQSLRAVVVFKDSASKEVRDALLAPIAGFQIRIAPVVIVWYVETAAVDEQSDRLRELLKAGALGFGEGKEKALEEQIIPIFESIREQFKEPGINEIDCGQGIAQATLMAFEQGLGTCCLGSPKGAKILEVMGVPESARFLLLQTVGYPLEHWEAGGQRPRLPFGDLFAMNTFDTPFPQSQEVMSELTDDGVFTRPAPLPGREEELEFLKNALGLKGAGLI